MVWVSDITAYRFHHEYFYICAILDLFSRKVIAYRVAKTSSTQLITLASRQAYSERRPEPGLIFHSDRGKQYLSRSFQMLLKESGVEQSLSRPGNPHDNAVMESFFSGRHSCSLSTALFSRSMEPKTEPEREFRYGHQGFGTADHTDTGIYFLKNFSVDIYQSPPL